MMNVKTEINVYEENGQDVPVGETKKISVESHWNRKNFVVIKIGKKTVTVVGSHLSEAISNAQNWSS